jgi:hypothetical protein
MWITAPTLLQCKDSEIAHLMRVLRRAQDVVSVSNHGGRGEEGLEKGSRATTGRPYIFFLRALRLCGKNLPSCPSYCLKAFLACANFLIVHTCRTWGFARAKTPSTPSPESFFPLRLSGSDSDLVAALPRWASVVNTPCFSRHCLRDSRPEASVLPRQTPSAAFETPACRSH